MLHTYIHKTSITHPKHIHSISIIVGFQLGSNWVPIGFQLGSSWVPVGFQLCSSWVPHGFQMGSSWVLISSWVRARFQLFCLILIGFQVRFLCSSLVPAWFQLGSSLVPVGFQLGSSCVPENARHFGLLVSGQHPLVLLESCPVWFHGFQ